MITTALLMIPMCVSAYIITYILMNFKKENKAQRTLLWVYISLFVLFLSKNLLTERIFSPYVDTMYAACLLYIYLAIYRVIVLLSRGKLAVWQQIFVFAPPILCAIAYTIVYTTVGPEAIEQITQLYAHENDLVALSEGAMTIRTMHQWTYFIFITISFSSLFLCLREVLLFKKRLVGFYSHFANRSTFSAVTALIVVVPTSAIGAYMNYSLRPDNLVLALVVASYTYALIKLAYAIIGQKFSYFEHVRTLEICRRNADDAAAERHPKQIEATFKSMMNEQQLFLNPDLQISDLAWPMKVSCEWLSNFLERTYGLTFFSIINRRRLQHAQMVLAAPKEQGRDNIIEDAWRSSGFGSRKAMNQVFNDFHYPPPDEKFHIIRLKTNKKLTPHNTTY